MDLNNIPPGRVYVPMTGAADNRAFDRTVQIAADPDVCYLLGDSGLPAFEHCGSMTIDMTSGPGASARPRPVDVDITKLKGGGPVTVSVIDGRGVQIRREVVEAINRPVEVKAEELSAP
ncbi:MAG TPA: hypothetical protein VHL54_02730 [Actinomycetota bacterium]|nr:hypothetical protein [Actinomycetota bacterium]